MPSHSRRRFLTTLVGGVAATTAASPAHGSSTATGRSLNGLRLGLAGLDPTDERYWQLVKEQFPLRPGLILMNAANLCPSSYPVADAVTRLTEDIDADASFQNREKFAELREIGRNLLAAYVGADTDEIAITRNTSEGNNTVVNGLTLDAGDEVVIWDQNHPTNNVSWDVRAERYGFTVVRVSTPPDPQTGAELIQPFVDKLSSRTRILSFSHVSNATGVGLPAKELCSIARDRGVLTLVDGAQTFGAVSVDLHDIGCDFYTGSSHKWFVGPKEAGLLYVRRDRVENLWPSNVGVGWEGALQHGAQKFENLGQRDDAAVSAMGTAAEFHQTIGKELVDSRVFALAARLKEAVAQRLPGVRFVTPRDREMSAGVVIFTVPTVATRDLFEALYSEHNIVCAAMGEGIRFSPHIYNTMEEIDRVVEAIAQLA